VSFDTQTILSAAVATQVAGVACGLAPVARHALVAAWEALAGGRRVGAGPKRQRLATILVAGELALSTALGVGTVLLAKSVLAQRLADHGYRVENAVALRLDLSALGFRTRVSPSPSSSAPRARRRAGGRRVGRRRRDGSQMSLDASAW
jgi:hypothetical protein